MNMPYIAAGTGLAVIAAAGIAAAVSAQDLAAQAELTREQAIEIALAQVPGTVAEIELERHRGALVYEVEILSETGQETEVEIAAGTGDILKIEVEDEACDKDRDA